MMALMLVAMTMTAVPAKPGLKKKVTLKDGSTVELTLRGDEHFSFYTDAKNQPCLLKDGELVMMTQEEVAQKWNELREKRLSISERAGKRAARRAGKPSNTTTGTQRGLVILVEFKDVKFVTENPQPVFNRFFNEEGYNEGGMAGSVKDYFKKQSYDQLTIEFDVVGPFTTANDMAYYGAHYKDDNGDDHNDIHPVLMVREAVDAAHGAGVDFSKYDWDKDGEVDQVFVIYAGYAEAQGGAKETIWPHEYVLRADDKRVKYDGVWIDTYGCAAELRGNTGTTMDGIGTACHEFSHCLGLPDMYDTNGQVNFGMSYWDVMDSGSYLDNSRTPAGYTSYERWFSGWMEPVEINEMTQIADMKPLATHPEAYVLYNEGRNKDITGEYYLLENRQPVGFDSKLYGHGMLILHVDYNENAWTTNKVNTNADHQRCTIIPADNEGRTSTKSLPGDPWPGTTGNTLLNNYSTPAATVFSKNVDGRNFMNKQIDHITENADAMTISFVACRPEMPAPDVEGSTVSEQTSDNSVTISWNAVEGAVGYEVELTSKDKAPTTPEEALQKEYDFAKFYSKTAGISAITGDLKSYGMENWTGTNLYTTPQKLRFGTSQKSGSLKSPWWYTTSSTNATLVLGANIVKNTVKGTVTYSNGDVVDGYIRNVEEVGTEEFEVTGDQKLVVHLQNINKAAYQFLIEPKIQMYLNYLAIYDGIWTAEQLGVNSSSSVPRRAVSTQVYPTETNSFTFKDLSNKKTYSYRLRSIGVDENYSAWSAAKEFEVSTTGIQSIRTNEDTDNTVRYYDLQGREVKTPTRGLYIRNGKKIVIK